MFELATVTIFLKYVTAFGSLLWQVFPQVQRHPGSQGLEPINNWLICYHLFCNREDNILNLKVNHSFEPNSEFILFSAHPVLGTVMALAAMEDMIAGQELTVNYGYVGYCRQWTRLTSSIHLFAVWTSS